MLFRSLTKWDDLAKTPAMLCLAQLLEEMLFEFSLDTYKPSVMHTGLLCVEALATIRAVEAGTIKAPNVFHVTAELAANFEKDAVATALSPLPPASFMPALKNPKTPVRELQTVLELLSVHLTTRKYRAKNEELLLATARNAGSMADIRRLARTYVTTLTSVGFSKNFLYEKTKEFFHYGAGRITGPDSLTDFFSLFPGDSTDYTVIFRVDQIFEHVSPAFDKMGLKITKNPPPNLDLTPYPTIYGSTLLGLYATIEKVPARDHYSARDSAERMLKLSSTLLTLFHHKERPAWLDECVVHNAKANSYHLVGAPTNSMHKCADLLQTVASKRLQEFISHFSLEEESFSRFVRSAQLHALAVGSNADENQILNLWIALESLVPSETKADDVCNIGHIIDSLVPVLNFGYIERLMNSLVKDLLEWNRNSMRAAIKAVPGKKLTEKLARIVALPEYAAEKNKIEAAFKEFHLLRSRFDYFSQMFASPRGVADALDAHRQRLEWQIRRIYRTRNIIVHSGTTPRYTKVLIEHTHDYLDTVLNALVRLASTPKSIHSVSQGFKFIELRYQRYYNELVAKGVVFDTKNITDLAYCR